MKNLWMITFLILIWCGFSNDFGIGNLLLGMTVSMLCCFLLTSQQPQYHIRLWPLLLLLAFTLVELIKSSLIVAWDVITPKHLSTPKVVEIELACKHQAERMLLANLISLTPGTLSIDLSEDKTMLKVHMMFAKDASQAMHFIKQRLEPKVLRVFDYADA